MEPSTKDVWNMDNIAVTLEKETGIDIDIILTNIDKAHPITRVENGRQKRIAKFRSDHFKKVVYKKHRKLKTDNATKRNKSNQPVKVPIDLQPPLTKYHLKPLQFVAEKFEGIRQAKFVFRYACLCLDMHDNLKNMLKKNMF